jgi:hypothetical protein
MAEAGVLDPVTTDDLDGLSAVALPAWKAMAIATCDPNEALMTADAELIPPPGQPDDEGPGPGAYYAAGQ